MNERADALARKGMRAVHGPGRLGSPGE
jgi:ribonuclease HI